MTAPKPSLGERPSRMKPADLGSAFGGSSRSDGLGGRLTPLRSTSPTLTPESTAGPVDDGTKPKLLDLPQTPAPAGNHSGESVVKTVRKPAAAAHRDSNVGGAPQTIVVYLGLSVRERLRAGAGDLTFTEVALAALDSSYGKLSERFSEPAPPTGSMFAGRGRPRTRRNREARVQVSLRPLRDDIAVIDRLVAEVNAPSRSALIDAALDEYLP
jgi:hypothetical protein